jgi:oligopeptide/dipeptide ABC transporter ATP-binding protein
MEAVNDAAAVRLVARPVTPRHRRALLAPVPLEGPHTARARRAARSSPRSPRRRGRLSRSGPVCVRREARQLITSIRSLLLRERIGHNIRTRATVRSALALTTSPRLVVADEPVSALDVSVQAQVLNLLLELQLRLTFIFVAHDLSVVRHISDRVAVVCVGQIVELATTEAVFARPRHPYTAALMRAVPVPDPRAASTGAILRGEVPSPAAPPSGCYFHPRCAFADDRCRGEAPLLREVTPGHFARCHFAEQLSLQAA